MKGITVVGCGVMGSSIIRALMKGGFEVTIVDLNEEAAKPLVAEGAKWFASLEDALYNETILINLPNDRIAKLVVNGVAPEKLNGKMVINTTTSTPEEVKDMDELLTSIGVKHLDAKIEVYPGDIGTESALLIYSGCKEVFDTNKEALRAIGRADYLGENVIAAAVTDIAVLEVHFAAIGGLAESAAYCIKEGYPINQYIESLREILPIMLEGNYRSFEDGLTPYTGEFEDASECTLDIETTSMETIVRAMNGAGVKTPIGDGVVDLFKEGQASGHGKKNVVAVTKELI